MASIAENIIATNNEKQALKATLAGKGIDMSNVPFTEYHEKVEGLGGGEQEKKELFIDYLYIDPKTGEDTSKRIYYDRGDNGVLPGFAVDVPAIEGHNPALKFQEWNHAVSDLTDLKHSYYVGASYVTQDGATYAYIELDNNTGTNIQLGLNKSSSAGTLTVDWGDGTSNTTSSSGIYSPSKTYSAIGKYVIKISITSNGTCVIGMGSSMSFIYGVPALTYMKNCVKRIYLGSGVASLGNYAFQEHLYLEQVTIPQQITSIGVAAFHTCHALKQVVFPSGYVSPQGNTLQYCRTLEKVSFCPNLEQAGNTNFFMDCCALQGIVFKGTFTSISSQVASGARGLKIYILDSPNIRIINSSFASNNWALENFEVPSTITSITNNAFDYNYALKSINLPDAITSIGQSAFNNCKSLQELILPLELTSVSASMCANCVSLFRIEIPAAATSIGATAFNACSSLQLVTIRGDRVCNLLATTAFSNTNLQRIYVPDNLVEDYKAATNWTTLADKIYGFSNM